MKNTILNEMWMYASNIKSFKPRDWLTYMTWVGLMLGLFLATFGFLMIGRANGVQFPAVAWNIPFGTFIFACAISLDTIGHLTIYKTELSRAEGFVHHMTIAAGISSSIALCLAYSHREEFEIPALVLIAMSFLYTVIDEAFHWFRYYSKKSDRVEMWSHFFIILGHSIMILSWWAWFKGGYVGVAQTLPYLPHL